MKYFFRNLVAIATLVCLPGLLGACTVKAAPPGESQGLSIVATLFPQYDFARQIVGDKAQVTLLLPPGGESHSYEPSPSDVIRISNADIFLYTGEDMETWVPKLLSGIDNPKLKVVDVSAGIALTESDAHDHNTFDPHIWTSPVNAQQMVRNIVECLKAVDPSNGSVYEANGSAYLEKLDALDNRFRKIVANGKRKDFIFASRFACIYFARQYSLEPDSPYDSCSAETEPGAQAMARVIDHIKSTGVPAVFYQELTEDRVVRSVAEATGAKPLLFHSCHNVTKEEFQQGATYLSLMEDNARRLEEGLN